MIEQLINAVTQYPAILYTSTFILGLIIGSFLNVVIYRLPIMIESDWREQCAELNENESAVATKTRFNLVTPRSRCSNCGTMIKSWHNIPVFSFLFLKGKCTFCDAPISIQYPLVELLTAMLSLIVVVKFGFTVPGFAALCLTWSLIALSVIDLKHTLLPDNITLPLLWFGLLLSLSGQFVSATEAIIGAIAGYLILWSVYWIFKLVTGKEGMGYGDFKLLAMLGAWMGWEALPGIILLSSLVGALVGISMIAFAGHDRRIPIPFGPYLAAAGWIYLLYGQEISNAYLNLLAA